MPSLGAVVRQVAAELGVLGADDRLTAVSSLVMVELVVSLEERLGINLFQPQFHYQDFHSVATVIEMIGRDSPTPIPGIEHERVGDRVDLPHHDDAAEQQLAALVAAWTDEEVSAQLAEWSRVELDVAPSTGDPRRALLDRLIAQHHIDVDVRRPLARRSGVTTTDTSFTQRRVWSINKLGDTARLGMAHGIALHGPLDVGALRKAVTALVQRQPALRTVFVADGDRVVQCVQPHGPELAVVDLSELDDAARMPRARQLFDELARPHDLAEQPFRIQLVRIAERHHLVFLAAHHMIADGFSFGLLWSDLDALYQAALSGQPAELPALEFDYADFSFWQSTLPQRPVGASQLAFWSNTIDGYQDLVIPGDVDGPDRVPGPELELFTAGETPFVIDGERWARVIETCAERKILPYHLIATAFFLLLTRCGGRDEAIVMGPSHARRRPGSESVIGSFVTPYLMRIAFDDELTLDQAVQRCRQAALMFHEHQGVAPTPALARWSELLRYNLNYQVFGGEPTKRIGGATMEALDWRKYSTGTVFDLALFISQGEAQAGGLILYNAQRFSAALAGRLAARLHWLVDELVIHPNQRVGALPRMP